MTPERGIGSQEKPGGLFCRDALVFDAEEEGE